MTSVKTLCVHLVSLEPDVAAHLEITVAEGESEQDREWSAFAKLINGGEGLAWCVGLKRPGDYYSTLYPGNLSQEEAKEKALRALLAILPPKYGLPDLAPRRNTSPIPQPEPFF